jgi:hypothetical protein
MKNKLNNLDVLVIACKLTEPDFKKIKKLFLHKKYLFLAMDPKTQIFLKNKKENFLSSNSFFESKVHKSILADSQTILNDYNNVINIIRTDKVHDCFTNLINYHLLFKIRQWLIIYFMIKNIKAKKIISFGLEEFPSRSLFSWCKQENIEIVQNIAKHSKLKPLRIVLVRFLNIFLFELLLIVYKIFYKNKRKSQLLATGPDRNLSEVVAITKKFRHDVFPVYLISSISFFIKNLPLFISGKLMIFKRVLAFISPQYKEEFTHFIKNIKEAISLINKMKPQDSKYGYLKIELNSFLKTFLYSDVIDLYRSYVGLKKIKQNNSSNLLFIAQHALGFQGLVGECTKDEDSLSLLITHGSHVKQTNQFSQLGWAETNKILINAKFTFSAMQTPLAYEYFKNEKNQKSKPLITSPLIFGLNKGENNQNLSSRKTLYKKQSKKFIFLHAGTPKEWKYFRPIIYETLDEYIQNLIDIIDAVKNIKNIFLAIRFRETDTLKLRELEELLPKEDCYQIFTDKTFFDYITHSDFLISYSSTTIEESLINKKPVILYNPKNHYMHIRGTILEEKQNKINLNTIYNINNKKDLAWSLNWLKTHHADRNKRLNWDKYTFNLDSSDTYKKLINKTFKN